MDLVCAPRFLPQFVTLGPVSEIVSFSFVDLYLNFLDSVAQIYMPNWPHRVSQCQTPEIACLPNAPAGILTSTPLTYFLPRFH